MPERALLPLQPRRSMHPESRLVAIELDPDFADILRSRCPQVLTVCGNVRDIDTHLAALRIDRFDVLLSGLPVPSLPRCGQRGTTEILRPNVAAKQSSAN